jgi:hypothetical protein
MERLRAFEREVERLRAFEREVERESALCPHIMCFSEHAGVLDR